MSGCSCILSLVAWLLAQPADPPKPRDAPAVPSPEQRAVTFLAREVPRWPREKKCFSCHNNGDGARALFAAMRRGYPVERPAVEQTLDWLLQPNEWNQDGKEGPEIDRQLAHLQFALALAEAPQTGRLDKLQALKQAAALVAGHQREDGSWDVQTGGRLGGPTTYGKHLATTVALRTLRAADSTRYALALEKAETWLVGCKVSNVLAASAVLLGLQESRHPKAAEQRRRALETLRAGAIHDGGWGPFVNAPAEPFDTAIAMLALQGNRRTEELDRLIAAGRRYLARSQLADGSWPATTRPPGAESYAQQISTTAWATLALLATER